MPAKNNFIRKQTRRPPHEVQFELLLLEDSSFYANSLKAIFEERLPTSVTIVPTLEAASALLNENPNRFFLGITSILDLNSAELEKIDAFGQLNLSVIAIINDYQEELRDQLIKRHVIDYVLKGNNVDNSYICDLIMRIYKNTNINVLIVDDSAVSRFVIARELSLQKFIVHQVDNCEDALKILETRTDIKMVLVDQQLKGMNGTTFVAKARQIYHKGDLIIIGLSTSQDARLSVKFLKAGANDFIVKPFDYEVLLCRISQNLDMLDAVDLAKALSNTDYLSGLNNRRYFFEQGAQSLLNSKENDLSTVLMIDIDHFKKINDDYGHDIGDDVIKNMAGVLKNHFSDAILARIGGEEFAVLINAGLNEQQMHRIQAFHEAVASEKVLLNDDYVQYTCSIGVCEDSNKSLDEMLAIADKNLYYAKQNGRNKVKVA